MIRYFSIIILMVLIIAGCSQTNNPATPDGQSSSLNTISVMGETHDSNGELASSAGVLGLFSAQIDTNALKGELISLRESTIDDALESVDITNFLSLAPCFDCAKILSVSLDLDGNAVVEIGIKHPFDAGDPFKPISGRNRGDLHVFNVEGTVIFDDDSPTNEFASLGETVASTNLLNADGYSIYLDTAIDDIYPTQATAHPYILHFDDYSAGNFDPSNPMGFESVTDPPPGGNLIMAMGCDYDVQEYVFGLDDDTSFEFIFAVGCTYAISASSKSERFNPEFQIPQHNKKAASEVKVEIVDNSLVAGEESSSAELLIKVLDINHGVPVGEGLNEMKSDSSVASILVEVPGVTSGAIGGPISPTGGDGRDPLNPLTFNVLFNNDLEANEGVYPGLVKVLDSYPSGLNELPLLNGDDAIKRVDPLANPISGLYSLQEFATYMVFSIEITGASHTPQASFTTDPAGDPDLGINYLDSVIFTSTSTDPDDPMTPEGQIVTYEWDFEWDGDPVNFIDDTSGAGTDIETFQYATPGIIQAGLRVTDGGSPPLISEIYSIQITIDEWSQDFVVDTNDGRVPKIAQMPGGNMILIWSGFDGQNHYSVFDDDWSDPDILCASTTDYLSISAGPGDNEAWAGGDIRWYRYTGSQGLWDVTTGEISNGIQTQICSVDFGGYEIYHNTNSAFGHIIRSYYNDITQYYPEFTYEYIWRYGGNNRLLGESRIIDKNSSGRIFLAYKNDLAIDPFQPPQDYRRLIVADMNQGVPGYTTAQLLSTRVHGTDWIQSVSRVTQWIISMSRTGVSLTVVVTIPLSINSALTTTQAGAVNLKSGRDQVMWNMST